MTDTQQSEVERACKAAWDEMKLIGCSKGYHEGASETWEEAPDNAKQELRQIIGAALATLRPKVSEAEVREVLENKIEALNVELAAMYNVQSALLDRLKADNPEGEK